MLFQNLSDMRNASDQRQCVQCAGQVSLEPGVLDTKLHVGTLN